MFRDAEIEIKVGIFVGVGIFLMFILFSSVNDFYILDKGYDVSVIFDFVNGINVNAPVRLAGVNAGEVKDIVVHTDESGHTRVRLDLWIKEGYKVNADSVARINTLGLLGERYIELTPGESNEVLSAGDMLIGTNPINVGSQVEKMREFLALAINIVKRVEGGEGTLGKLVNDDKLYDDLSFIFERLRKGEGTLGKLLSEEKIYNDAEELVGDIKDHPWKLLHKPSTSRRKDKKEQRKKYSL